VFVELETQHDRECLPLREGNAVCIPGVSLDLGDERGLVLRDDEVAAVAAETLVRTHTIADTDLERLDGV
jgi:hypothetical protein